MIRVGTVQGSVDLAALLGEFDLGEGPFVIVANWHCTQEGYGTDAQTLRYLLEVLPGEKIVIEAYDAARTDDPSRFSGLDLDEAQKHWEYLREQDRIFLRTTGIGEVLEEHGAEYLNITEEVWGQRVADATEVQAFVEQRYGPIGHKELYGMVPQRLWELRGQSLVNYAKMKAGRIATEIFFSLSMKNFFGLIPVPNRESYHGSQCQGLSSSIVDTNIIYCSVFKVISICEAIRNTLLSSQARFADKHTLVKDLQLAVASDKSVELDAFLVTVLGDIPENRHFLQIGSEVFGSWNSDSFPSLPSGIADRLRKIMGVSV
ncbi:MAG: DUF362 domain-containing protein [Phycisphaerae bacterium]|nr:DUF362 domain-containing protein [Phycisphaerae bacterium]